MKIQTPYGRPSNEQNITHFEARLRDLEIWSVRRAKSIGASAVLQYDYQRDRNKSPQMTHVSAQRARIQAVDAGPLLLLCQL